MNIALQLKINRIMGHGDAMIARNHVHAIHALMIVIVTALLGMEQADATAEVIATGVLMNKIMYATLAALIVVLGTIVLIQILTNVIATNITVVGKIIHIIRVRADDKLVQKIAIVHAEKLAALEIGILMYQFGLIVGRFQ